MFKIYNKKITFIFLLHGSKKIKWLKFIFKKKILFNKIKLGFLEFIKPNINNLIKNVIKKNHRKIFIFLIFIGYGNHINKNITNLKINLNILYPKININFIYNN